MYVQSSYSFQALLDSAVILNDPQSLGISHWVTYCTASTCTGLFSHCLWSRLKSLCDSSALVQIFIWLHTFVYGYILFIWLHIFLYDYTHFYMVTCTFIWLHSFLCGYTHFYVITHIFMWLYTFLYGYTHFYVVIYIFMWLRTFLFGYIHFYMVTYIFIWLHTFYMVTHIFI